MLKGKCRLVPIQYNILANLSFLDSSFLFTPLIKDLFPRDNRVFLSASNYRLIYLDHSMVMEGIIMATGDQQ